MGPVLVGLDGSPESLAALRWAAWLAATTQRKLHAAHAWQRGRKLEPPPSHTTDLSDIDGVEAATRASLRAMVEEQLADATVVTDYLALRGEVADCLAKESQGIFGSLLVVGARGTGGASRKLLGSVSRRLTQAPGQAVAVVPDHVDAPTTGSWSAVVAVDGSTGSSRALRWAAAAAARGSGRVVVVHTIEPPLPDLTRPETDCVADEMQRRLDEEWCAPLRKLGVDYTTVVGHGDARDVIRRVADDVRPACVVVGSRGLGPISQRLLGSVTHRLVRELEWTTVIVPAPRDSVTWRP